MPNTSRPKRVQPIAGSLAATAAVAALLTACSAPTPEVPKFDASSICKEVDTSRALPKCVTAFTDGAPIRIPNVNAGTGSFGVLTAQGTSDVEFVDAAGKSFAVSSSVVASMSDKIGPENAQEIYANTIFYGARDGEVVTALSRVATVDGTVIVNAALGGRVLEGRVSKWEGEESGYSGDPTLALQIRVESSSATSNGQVALAAKITNASSPVTLQNGDIAPALSDAGNANPLQNGFSESIQLQRVPSMHAAFDDELVLVWSDSSSGMGSEFYPSVATAAGLAPLRGEWAVTQHGVPSSGPALLLSIAS